MNPSNKSPFMHIYREIAKKLNEKSFYSKKTKEYIKETDNNSSIDNILSTSSEALLDKVFNSASFIISRLKIHRYLNNQLDYISLDLSNKKLELDRLCYSGDMNIKKLINSLDSQIIVLEQQKLQERVKCWNDLLMPMKDFLDLFFKHKELEQDKKMLEEE